MLEQSHRDPEKEPLVRLLAASKFFGRTRAFGPVDFALESGESAALIGRSGAGKSSLARCLSGLEPLSEGRRLLLPGLESRSIQLVFQDSPVAMNPAWTVQAILAEPLRVAGIPVTLDGLRERLEEVGLTAELENRLPSQLSGGQRRRLMIARALAVPGLRAILLDEPFSGLHREASQELASLLRTIHLKRNITLLLITHDLMAVSLLASRVLVMGDGFIVEELPAVTFHSEARHPESRALIEAALA